MMPSIEIQMHQAAFGFGKTKEKESLQHCELDYLSDSRQYLDYSFELSHMRSFIFILMDLSFSSFPFLTRQVFRCFFSSLITMIFMLRNSHEVNKFYQQKIYIRE